MNVFGIQSYKILGIDKAAISSFEYEGQYMHVSVELLKVLGIVSSEIAQVVESVDGKYIKWNRNEAVTGALLVRTSKLISGFLDQVCKKRLEIAKIIFRCLADCLISLKYFLLSANERDFDEFVEYSLRSEKRLLEIIRANARERAADEPIEIRMKNSIEHSFKASSVGFDDVDSGNRKSWGGGIFKRAERVGLAAGYLGLFGLPSHDVHSNWESLMRFDLDAHDDGFLPRRSWANPRPQIVLAAGLFSAPVIRLYAEKRIPDTGDKARMFRILDEVLSIIKLVDREHEGFLSESR